MEPTYLGDGVYAVYAHGQIELRTNDLLNPTDIVYLDMSTFKALTSFGNSCFGIQEKNHGA